MKLNRLLILFTLCSITGLAVAFEEGTPLSSMVSTLMVGGNVLSKLMWAVCIVVGIALIAAAFTQFQIHRRNPKLVPLTTPVLYLILGICAIALPFLGQMEGFMSEGESGVKGAPARTTTSTTTPVNPPARPQYNPNDIDAPLY